MQLVSDPRSEVLTLISTLPLLPTLMDKSSVTGPTHPPTLWVAGCLAASSCHTLHSTLTFLSGPHLLSLEVDNASFSPPAHVQLGHQQRVQFWPLGSGGIRLRLRGRVSCKVLMRYSGTALMLWS